MTDSISVKLSSALSGIWDKIRSLHPKVPPVVLLAAPADKRLNALGYFAALRWSTAKEKQNLIHEVVVVGEYLDRSAEEIVGTLIHEAAHAQNFEEKIHDCSRSQYHNKKFKAVAEKMGLAVRQISHYGFALTEMTEETRNIYRKETEVLKDALVHRRKPIWIQGATSSGKVEEESKNTSRSRKAVCKCPFIIRVSKKTLDETVIRCESCEKSFEFE